MYDDLSETTTEDFCDTTYAGLVFFGFINKHQQNRFIICINNFCQKLKTKIKVSNVFE